MLDFTDRHFTKLLILKAIRWYLSYPLSYQHVEELMKERGVKVDIAQLIVGLSNTLKN